MRAPSPILLPLALAAGLAPAARAADLPFIAPPLPIHGVQGEGGGFRVARIPIRPGPLRYDIYGYPVLPGVPSPLAVGNGCPAALEPDYDPDGNFAGYAPIPMCR